jgi:excisionase family DNA binding protein
MKSELPPWMPRPLLTVKEVAEVLHISVRQVRRLIEDGRLAAVRIGRAVRVRPEAAAELINPP